MCWPPADLSIPSITAFRSMICDILQGEASRPDPRSVVILALDGIPHALAAAHWPKANVSRCHSVFPTATSTAWLSALTGMPVSEHGVPGYRFVGPHGGMIDIFAYKGEL